MADYNLAGLNSRDFEHLTQALAINYVAPGVTPFGDGPDGGREATFQGSMSYPSTQELWNGYLVIQSKFLVRPTGDTGKDGDWAIAQLKGDLGKFIDPKRGLPKPEYYIFVTNVVLTPVQGSGTKDKAFAIFEQYKDVIGLKGYDVWDFDKLCRLIDGDRSVRTRFAGFITTGDVLSKVLELLEGQEPSFANTMSLFLQKEMRADQFVKLEQAGNTADQKTPLAQVFVDLPVSEQLLVDPPETDSEERRLTFDLVAKMMRAGSQILKGSVLQSQQSPNSIFRQRDGLTLETGRYVIVGGPGQGKSTVGQFVAQLYRAALLTDRPTYTLSYEAQSTLNFFMGQCEAAEVELPLVRRFPIRVVLDQFATSLANGSSKSLLSFIARRFKDLTDTSITTDNLRSWLASYPWLIVLDGLDEVPPTSNRKQVLEKVTEFWSEVATLDADVLIIATTRPQGYNDDFSPRFYKHLYLAPLSSKRALHYANRLVDAQHSSDPDRRNKVLSRLQMACEQETTRRLMRSPLQVTIMATLVDRIGQPPQERWRLFRQYYEVIYQRETERDIPASRILQQRKADVNTIHYRVGLLLQTESEHAGSTDSKLPSDRFYKLVHERIAEEGHEGVELEARTREITEAALHRLVFLVGLESERIGFEIRSLQEFMAAEALMNGREEQVRARLESIAPIVHWRNVFLFAAGNCFAERQFLRDMIVTICEQLNDSQEDKLAGVTLAGSRLALDVLEDGVAREQPKYARSLAKVAILLMALPDIEANMKLASIYNEHLEQIFIENLERSLETIDFAKQLGAWAVVMTLIGKEVAWATNLAEKYWPNDIKQQYTILEYANNAEIHRWVKSKFISLVPKIEPWRAFSFRQMRTLLSEQNISERMHTPYFKTDTPQWYNAIETILLREYRSSRSQSNINTLFH
jgi:hypothetical protein